MTKREQSCRGGFYQREAENGQEAVDLWNAFEPHLIWMDMRMPVMDGYEATKRIKADLKGRTTVIIALTASAFEEERHLVLSAGCDDFVRKPFREQVIPENLQVLSATLTQRGYRVRCIVTGQMAIRAARSAQPDLILLDIRMPDINGYEICERLKSDAQTSKIPVIFISALDEVLDKVTAFSVGGADYITKPFQVEEVLARVEHQLTIRKLSKQLQEQNQQMQQEIQERRKAEEAAAVASKAKNEFIININHELRTSLNAILGFTQLMTRDIGLNDEQREYLEIINRSGEKFNLLGNAIKFTEFGSVILRVKRGNTPYSLEFEVEDTGSGIAPEELEGLFDAFVQTETGRKSAEGSGLGLSITRRFVQLLGGDIRPVSILGEGTTFRFDVRIAQTDSSEIIAKPCRRVVGLEPGQREYHILVVDDTQENCLLLVKLLKPIGFGVREAENGREGVAVWESWQPQMIWMDTRMPVLDGLEAARQIRARERSMAKGESEKATIMIALTASAFEERRAEILAAGFDDFVRKPFSEEEIFQNMRNYLGVRYLYEDLPQPTTALRRFDAISAKPDSFFLEELAAMPPNWIASLNQAANEVNEELLLQLTEQISDTNATLAEALTDLVNDYHLDKIVCLTQSFI